MVHCEVRGDEKGRQAHATRLGKGKPADRKVDMMRNFLYPGQLCMIRTWVLQSGSAETKTSFFVQVSRHLVHEIPTLGFVGASSRTVKAHRI